jgi:hypothetical protein
MRPTAQVVVATRHPPASAGGLWSGVPEWAGWHSDDGRQDLPGRAGQVHSWRIVQAVVGSTVVQFLVVFLAAVALLVMHPLLIR